MMLTADCSPYGKHFENSKAHIDMRMTAFKYFLNSNFASKIVSFRPLLFDGGQYRLHPAPLCCCQTWLRRGWHGQPI